MIHPLNLLLPFPELAMRNIPQKLCFYKQTSSVFASFALSQAGNTFDVG
jgi:hypothetical protein